MSAIDLPQLRRWRITLLTAFPKLVISDMSNGFPEKLEFGSRIGESSTSVGEVSVHLAAAVGGFPEISPMALQMRDLANLTFEVSAATAHDAMTVSAPVIDLVVDDLSFQLQEPLPLDRTIVLDITPPLTVGDQREYLQYNSYDQYKLSRTVAMGNVQTVPVPFLRSDYATLPRRTQDALDWYIKSLHTPWDADKYIFLWISFEILRNASGPKVEEPTRLRCGHELASCPECSRPTMQVRQAASTYKFFEELGIDQPTAKALWDMRQLVHGAKSFKPDKLERLGELLQVLRAICATALKAATGNGEHEPPIVGYGALAVSAAMGVGGTIGITEADLLV